MHKGVVVITGSAQGMGRAAAELFLEDGFEVHGIDIQDCLLDDDNYTHHIADVSDYDSLPDIENVAYLINNAGVQGSDNDIEINLNGVINCTKKYGLQKNIKSILNQASVSAHNGAEFPEYAASKGGVLSYTRAIAKYVGHMYHATCNSISFGGVLTELNQPVIDDKECWDKIMSMTPLDKWVTVDEAAQWIYFLTVINQSMTAQDVLIDNGEFYNHEFVWK